jgi:DNA-binding MarR family transcriptional regulator
MEENRYRESRICRLLGNPIVYQVIVLLDSGGPLSPSRLADLTRRKVSTVSIHLAKLRAADLVRYETAGKETRYWLKHKARTKGLIRSLGRLVGASTKLR